MQTAATPNQDASSHPLTSVSERSPSDVKFISELGRSLLFTIHPKKVASRVAEAIWARLDAQVCGFAVELENIGLISSISRRNKGADGSFKKRQLEKWLSFMPPQVGYREADAKEFLIAGRSHASEYVSPLHIDGEIRGAIVIGFAEGRDIDDTEMRLVDAATQMAAMSVNLTSHYESAMNDSVNEAREENRKFTEAILDALPLSLYVVDRDYKIVTWNKQREVGELGIPRDMAVGRDVFDVLDKYPQGRVREEFERAFRTGRIERIEQQTISRDGTAKHWMISKVPMKAAGSNDVTHVISIGEDVTVRVEAIHAMNRAEKLAAVGRLAAGIVHEINNPLATIAACAESMEQRVEEGAFDTSDAVQDLGEYLGLIKSEAFRCKTITTDLLDFSRVRTGERSPVDAGDIVRSAANLLSHQKRGHNVAHELDIESNSPLISADAGQIQQAIIALATNAIDAMPDGGTLTFRVAGRGNRVLIEVEDTGHGIPQEDVSKIFEPFFTTKEVGKGTGLGLAVCYGIISEHGGRISVRSTVAKGTTFSIFLPIADE